MTSFPSLSPAGERRQARLVDARLQAVVDASRPVGELERFATAICGASVDVVRLHDETASEDALRTAADALRRVCDRSGALFVVDALPGLALQVGADGVHVSRTDVHPDHARRTVGPDLLVGRTAHTRGEYDRAADEDVDYVAVTRELAPHAAGHPHHPWFADAGPDLTSAAAVLDRGARRLVADSCLRTAADPAALCWALRRALAAHLR
ncbi:MAG TPA: thiamine phosphate synthase [Nitriliruptorales bacterium]|nr:thiamine phosphate synthase [Nitriliruptorales bacterium]